jgi:pSer/pThr/pTyr-binding forkhead associated (FHA) protein
LGARPFVRVDIRLPDPLVAKEHFEVVWDERLRVHIVRNRGARYLPRVNGTPVGDDGQRLSVGDVISIGAWTVEYVALEAG